MSDSNDDHLSEDSINPLNSLKNEFHHLDEISYDSIDQIIKLVLSEFATLKQMMHPIKLVILSILTKHTKIARYVLKKKLKIKSGTLGTLLDGLEEWGYISKQIEFDDNKPRIVIYITPIGYSHFQRVSSILKSVLQ